jgi:hypothetical protein
VAKAGKVPLIKKFYIEPWKEKIFLPKGQLYSHQNQIQSILFRNYELQYLYVSILGLDKRLVRSRAMDWWKFLFSCTDWEKWNWDMEVLKANIQIGYFPKHCSDSLRYIAATIILTEIPRCWL